MRNRNTVTSSTKLLRNAVLLTSSTLLLSGCGKPPEPPQAPPPAVVVTSVKKTAVHPSKDFVGRTQASEDAKIHSRVQGYLLSYLFKEGDMVEKGDLLFEIDPKDLSKVVDRDSARVRQAEAAMVLAEKNYQRGKELAPKGYISQSDMDSLETTKLDAEANLQAAKSDLQTSKLNLSYTKVTAPISGKISRSNPSVGDLITPEQELTTIVQLDPIYVNVQVDENTLLSNRLRRKRMEAQNQEIPPMDISLRLPNGDDYPHEGELDYIDNRVDASTGTIRVRTHFPNPNKVLLPGQYVTVIAKSTESEMSLLIPQSSVQQDQQGHFVLIVDEKNTVAKQPVELSSKVGIEWVVKDGLEEGQRVIVEGVLKARPGIVVAPTEQQQKPFSEDEPKEATQQQKETPKA